VAVFLGHLYPLYFGFKGGKGVSTALGVLLGLSTWVALTGLVVFIGVAALSRYVSLASITAAVTVTLASAILLGSSPYTVAIVVIAGLVVWRHRANIARLLSGSERKLNFGRSQAPPADPAA
jgi:glycerol-3-phosphate acyltransferase PlsY